MRATATAAVGRSRSATTMAARACPSQPASTAVRPLSPAASTASRSMAGTSRDSSVNSWRLPTVTTRSPARPRTPAPSRTVNSVTDGRPPNRAAASRAIAWPMGCSDASSTAPASSSASFSSVPGEVLTPTTFMTPSVRVPVLSSTTTRIRRAGSSARAPLTRMPSSAPRPTAATSAVGVARPSAHGQATTRTATAALQAAAADTPAPSQKPSVAQARLITQGTKTAAIRSARRCALALLA